MPKISFPRANGNLNLLALNNLSLSNSLKKTNSRCLFGISIPIASLPGIVDILVDLALIDLAISSDNLITLEDKVPGAGVSSKRVTIGPCLTSVICPLILKSLKTPANKEVFNSAFFLFSDSMPGVLDSLSSKSIDGNL